MANKYLLRYSLVIVTRGKRTLFGEDELVMTLEDVVMKVCKSFDIEVLDFGVDFDHIHLQFKTTPYIKLDQFIRTLQSKTNSMLKSKHKQEVKKYYRMGSIWSKDYCITTDGGISLETIKEHLAMEKFNK